jgi:hypothetical protein
MGRNTRCEWGGQNPVQKTGQCDDPGRARVRFWDGKTDCSADPACLVVAALSATNELDSGKPWSGSGLGLDAWAERNVAENRERARETDSKNGGLEWACGQSSASHANRRWELAGYALTPQCSYTAAGAFFHGWEGGTGMFDCENLYYRFGPAGETFVSALAFGFGKVDLP